MLSKLFDTQVPSISTEEFVLLRHARCVLSRLRCNGHRLLLSSYLSRIGRMENPSCSACGHTSQDTRLISFCSLQLHTLCGARFWQHFVLPRPLVQTLGSYPASKTPWSSAMSPSLGRDWVTTTSEFSHLRQQLKKLDL